MKTREEILVELQEGLSSGVLTEADIQPFVARQPEVAPAPAFIPENKPEKLSAVDVMFYVAGIVLFSAVVSIVVQTWDDGNALVRIFLSAGIGMGLWSVAYYLIKSSFQNDIRRGLTNSLLLTGSLLVILGGYIVTNEIIGGFDKVNYIPAAFALAILGGLHIGFDRLIKRDLILLMGVLLSVAAFPVLLSGLLQDLDVSMDVWVTIFILTSALLAYATRVVAKVNPDREKIHSSFDSLAAFLALLSMYVASYGDYGVLWFGILIAAIFGIFYLSIIMQNKHLLGNASFFMVLTIVTISFKYFSGYGITFSLIVAAIGLLGSAAVASNIHKKYFKQPA
jgi:MFS family permease